jgi:hypothetical protein
MPTDLELRFHEAMLDIYRRAKSEAGYTASLFLKMVSEVGGLEAARRLINAPDVSDGYTRLWDLHRLDLSVEAVALCDQWEPLFSREELRTARHRLKEYGYDPDERAGQADAAEV